MFLFILSMCTLAPQIANSEMILSCAGRSGERGYEIRVRDQALAWSVFALRNSDGVTVERPVEQLSVHHTQSGMRYELQISALGLKMIVYDQPVPVVTFRQFGLTVLRDNCSENALVWRPSRMAAARRPLARNEPLPGS